MVAVWAYSHTNLTLEAALPPGWWGVEVERIYADLASDLEPTHRPQIQQLLADAATLHPSYLLVRRLDELGPTPAAVAACMEQLQLYGCRVLAINHGPTDSYLAPDNLQTGADLQTAQHRRRLRQGHARSRLAGQPPPGPPPYGYRRSQDRYVLDRAAAPVVKAFFEQFLLYGSLRAAVRYIEKKYGKKISVSTGQRWLTHAAYRGDLSYGDGAIRRDTHTPILSRQEAAQIDRLRRRNRPFAARTASAPRSLAGLVRCHQCGCGYKVSRVATANREYLYLTPKSCPQQPKCKALAYQAVLEATVEQICQQLPAAVEQANLEQLATLKAQVQTAVEQQQRALGQLETLVGQGILDRETADLRAYRLRSTQAQQQLLLEQFSPVNLEELVQSVGIPQFWLDLSEAERRFFFREFIHRIDIAPTEAGWELQLKFVFSAR